MTTDTQKLLLESMHSLVTPEFTGTHEEMIGVVGYWVAMITQLRSLFAIVTSYENRSAIIMQLDKEVAIMKAELENISAKPATDSNGQHSMVQPIAQPNAPVGDVTPTTPEVTVMEPPTVDLSVHEAAMQRMRANAGVKSNIKVHPLSKVY